MARRYPLLNTALATAVVLGLFACGSSGNSDVVFGEGQVFLDTLAPGVDYQAFAGSDLTAFSIDAMVAHTGTSSMKIAVPATGYAGGAFPSATPRGLTGFNAFCFWVKASKDATLNVAGFGNDNTGNSVYPVELGAIPVTTTWTKVIIPVPVASKLTAETGLFHYAEGSDEGAYTIWIDDVQFEALPAADLGTPVPHIATETRPLEIGATTTVTGNSLTIPVTHGGVTADVTVALVGKKWMTYASSATSVASVDASGVITGVAAGTADITAMLGTTAATGAITVNVSAPQAPTAAAPTPTAPTGDVISLFSNAYTNVTVDTWSASWDSADVADVQIAGNDVRKYTNLVFAGIEFTSATIDASSMVAFHLDIWTPIAGTFKVKLVDFGAGGVWGGGDDVEHELTFNATTTPAIVSGSWISLDLPLSSFTNLTTRGHLAQLIISGTTTPLFVDNVYFHK